MDYQGIKSCLLPIPPYFNVSFTQIEAFALSIPFNIIGFNPYTKNSTIPDKLKLKVLNAPPIQLVQIFPNKLNSSLHTLYA